MQAIMEPKLAVPASLQPVLEELRRLEPLFHAAYPGAATDRFEQLVAPEFWEVGASGRRYSREFCLGVLRDRQRTPAEEEWVTRDFHVAAIAADTFLLTYTLEQPGRVTRRATLWRRCADGWKAVYHQGTVVA
ncbi:MAG: hypothetical protein P4L83_20780 [Nevskia sp.]|nr:hypothetical protein [Nevskia sp.]